jgi:hypothetical protein
VLFVGEAPPASGRFFYRADSGLYRAFRDCFAGVFPEIDNSNFLVSFQTVGCYLVDLCGRPVDHLGAKQRKMACLKGEAPLAITLKRLSPKIVVTVVLSIGSNVKRSVRRANFRGRYIELPYPGRWHQHRARFVRELACVLHELYYPTGELGSDDTVTKSCEQS